MSSYDEMSPGDDYETCTTGKRQAECGNETKSKKQRIQRSLLMNDDMSDDSENNNVQNDENGGDYANQDRERRTSNREKQLDRSECIKNNLIVFKTLNQGIGRNEEITPLEQYENFMRGEAENYDYYKDIYLDPNKIVQAYYSIQGSDSDKIALEVDKLYTYFGGNELKDFSHSELCDFAKLKFPRETVWGIEQTKRDYIRVLSELMLSFCALQVVDIVTKKLLYKKIQAIQMRVEKLSEALHAFCSLQGYGNLIAESSSLFRLDLDVCTRNKNLSAVNQSSRTTSQFYVRNELAKLNLRKHPKTLEIFEPVYNLDTNGKQRFMHSYRPYKSTPGTRLKEVIASLPGHQRVDSHFVSLCSSDMGSIVSTLEGSNSTDLPDLLLKKNLRSFKNGIYDMTSDIFYPWDCEDFPHEHCTAAYYDLVYNMELCKDEYKDPCDFASGKWYNMFKKGKFCSKFYQCLSHQYPKCDAYQKTVAHNVYKHPEKCLRFVLAFLGRHFYELNEIEIGWQKSMAIIGAAGTGKSMLMKVVAKLVPNNFPLKASGGEITFGMEGIVGKDLVLVDELTEKTTISADNILNMGSSSGRSSNFRMVVPTKNKRQIEMIVTQPIMVTGNSWPSSNLWANEAKQQLRRWCGVYFDRIVTKRDPSIESTCLNTELSAIMTIAVRAYQSLNRGINSLIHSRLKESMTNNIEIYMPQELLRDTMDIMNSSDIARDFLSWGRIRSDKLGIRSELMIPLEVLQKEYEDFMYRQKRTHSYHGRQQKLNMSRRDFDSIVAMTKCDILQFAEIDDDEKDGKTNRHFGNNHYPAYSTFALSLLKVNEILTRMERGNYETITYETEELYDFKFQCKRNPSGRRNHCPNCFNGEDRSCFVQWGLQLLKHRLEENKSENDYSSCREIGGMPVTAAAEKVDPVMWPFVKNFEYNMGWKNRRQDAEIKDKIDCQTKKNVVMVCGIGLDLTQTANDRVNIRSHQDGVDHKYKGQQLRRVFSQPLYKIIAHNDVDDETKLMIIQSYLHRVFSHTNRHKTNDSQEKSKAKWIKTTGAHHVGFYLRPVDGYNCYSEDGPFSKHDVMVMESIKQHLSLESLLKGGKSIHGLTNDAGRFVRFELYSLICRLKCYIRENKRKLSESYPLGNIKRNIDKQHGALVTCQKIYDACLSSNIPW